MLEVGKHLVRVTNVQFTAGGEGRTDQLAIRFEDETGEGISWYSTLGWKKDGSYSQSGAKYALDQLANLGWNAEAQNFDFETLGAPDVSPIMGREAEIVVVDEPYNGKSQIKVKWINDPTAPRASANAMDAGAAKTFAQRTRDAMRKAGFAVSAARPAQRGAARAPATKPAPVNEPWGDDSTAPF
jgi:hypothetical protein